MLDSRIGLQHFEGDLHIFTVTIGPIHEGIELHAQYESGSLPLAVGTTVARWPVTYLPPIAGVDRGQVSIGNGRIEIEVAPLRGLGLGSLFMYYLITWIQTQPNVPVDPILLSIEDARTPAERDRRNRFYERLGFRFAYQGDREWGDSLPLESRELVAPEPSPKTGWTFAGALRVRTLQDAAHDQVSTSGTPAK